MEKERFDKVAAHLIASARDTTEYSRQFLDDHSIPPTLMAKVHHFRAIVQAHLLEDEAYDLAAAYSDFGRVEFVETTTEDAFLLKSAGALAVEKRKDNRAQLALFAVGDLLRPTDVHVLIYGFDKTGLTLSIASAVKRASGGRVFVQGDPLHVGFWPYRTDDEVGGDGMPFDQENRDPFAEVGALNEGGEHEEGAS